MRLYMYSITTFRLQLCNISSRANLELYDRVERRPCVPHAQELQTCLSAVMLVDGTVSTTLRTRYGNQQRTRARRTLPRSSLSRRPVGAAC